MFYFVLFVILRSFRNGWSSVVLEFESERGLQCNIALH